MDYQMLVNRNNGLSKDFIPEDLRDSKSRYKDGILINGTALDAFKRMQEDALKLNYSFDIESGYRGYDYQARVYKEIAEEKGQDYALKCVAIPGYSEHQTGLALDICVFRGKDAFIDYDMEHLPETKWVHDNCYKYGFIIRYPKNKEEITGYNYEPWHLRYVGTLAKYLHENELTLEEYYGKNYDNTNGKRLR